MGTASVLSTVIILRTAATATLAYLTTLRTGTTLCQSTILRQSAVLRQGTGLRTAVVNRSRSCRLRRLYACNVVVTLCSVTVGRRCRVCVCMAIAVGYGRFSGSSPGCHQARVVVPCRAGSIVLSRIIIAVSSVTGRHTACTERTGNIVINRITVGIRSVCPGTAARLCGRTVTCTGSAYAVINRITVGIFSA